MSARCNSSSKSASNSRGTAWHGCGTPCHSTRKALKYNEIRSGQVRTLQNVEKSFVYKALGDVCSLLRQVCMKYIGGSIGLPMWNRSLRSLARVSGAIILLAFVPQSGFADSWKSAASSWSSGSSFAPATNGQREAPERSSFRGIEVKSSFDLTPRSQPQPRSRQPFVMPQNADELTKVRALIFHAESRQHGYDAYNLSARVPPPKPASKMTLKEIQQWTKDTPGQQHAIGRYQIIPSTLNRLIKNTGVDLNTVFDPAVQDAFANLLIIEAGYLDLKDRRISLKQFEVALAKVWAGFPLSNGKSYYAGVANNAATVSYKTYSSALAQIFPAEARLTKLAGTIPDNG